MTSITTRSISMLAAVVCAAIMGAGCGDAAKPAKDSTSTKSSGTGTTAVASAQQREYAEAIKAADTKFRAADEQLASVFANPDAAQGGERVRELSTQVADAADVLEKVTPPSDASEAHAQAVAALRSWAAGILEMAVVIEKTGGEATPETAKAVQDGAAKLQPQIEQAGADFQAVLDGLAEDGYPVQPAK